MRARRVRRDQRASASVDQPVPVEIVIEPARRSPSKETCSTRRVVAVAAAVLALVVTFVAVRDPNFADDGRARDNRRRELRPRRWQLPNSSAGLTFTALTVVGGQLVQQFGTFNSDVAVSGKSPRRLRSSRGLRGVNGPIHQ